MRPSLEDREAIAAPADEPALNVENILRSCRAAFEQASSIDWRSHDPFDFLLVALGEPARRRSALAARVLVQLGKRGGAPIRRLTKIAPHEEAKAIADFVSASVLLTRLGAAWSQAYLEPLCARLERLAVKTGAGVGWGLSFPYASRFASVPAYTPNAYTTVSCVSALTSAAVQMSDDRLLELATRGASMISTDIGIVRDGPRGWFRYWPGDDTCIVNIQPLIAACFQNLGSITNDERLVSEAALVAGVPARVQREDGSFPYCADERGQFVDAFHTGFVLEGLTRFRLAGGHLDPADAGTVVGRGMEFLRARLIGPSRLPRSSPDGSELDDGQNVGQLIQTLVICGDQADRRLALEIWRRWSGLARNRGGARLISLRWDVAPAILAASHLAAALSDAQ